LVDDGKVIDDVYELARGDAETQVAQMKAAMQAATEDAHAIGALQMIRFQEAQGRVVKLALLYKAKVAREYREHGLTWDQFCQRIGEKTRTVDRMLTDLRPIFEEMEDQSRELIGMDLSKLRWLGRNLDGTDATIEDGQLVVHDRRISISPENSGEIAALIEELKTTQQQLLDEKEKQLDEKRNEVEAHKKKAKARAETIDRLSRDLSKYEAQPENERADIALDALKRKVGDSKNLVEGVCLQMGPNNDRLFPTDDGRPTLLMISEYMSALAYMKRAIVSLYDEAQGIYGDRRIDTDDAWEPGKGAASVEDNDSIDNYLTTPDDDGPDDSGPGGPIPLSAKRGG